MTHALTTGEAIIARGRMTEDDVKKLRREIFDDGATDKGEADLVFRLENEVRDKHESWNQLYVDALTDFFVWKAVPRGYVSEEQARYLIREVVRDNRIESGTELELMCNIMHWAESCPAELAEFVLYAVRDSILDPDESSYGRDREPKVVDPVDVELIKRAIYAPATQSGTTVTRKEADVIFDINDATIETTNHPSWDRLFVFAIANHLMYPLAPYVPAPAEEVLRREEWLKERRGTAKLLKQVGKELVFSAKTGRLEWKHTMDTVLEGSVREIDAAEEARLAMEFRDRESIDETGARWLIERIERDGVLHKNEVALLTFIRNNSPEIHPSLEALMAEAGV